MPKSQIVYLEHESEVLADNPLGDPHVRTLPVYLPPDYEVETRRRYPVIWVLAPFTSWGERFFNLQAWDENIVQRMERLIRAGEARPAIMAFPDAFTRYGGSQYLNSPAVGRYEDYLTQELVPLVDGQFRTLAARDQRGVMGYSSGGYGALMMAMRHPDLFGAAASHSGDMYFELCYWPDIPGAIRVLEKFDGVEGFLSEGTGVRERGRDWGSALNAIAMSACYSPNPDSPHGFDLPFDPYTGVIREEVWARWKALDPIRLAPQHRETLKGLRGLYFDCGIRDEYNLFLGARWLHRILDEHGVPHRYEEFEGGHRHINWRYDTSLPFLTAALAPDGE
jgi:enterochelin esterase-like enzyme